jgi:hypothetical protein
MIHRVVGWVSPYSAQTEVTSPEKVIASTEPAARPKPIAGSSTSPYGSTNQMRKPAAPIATAATPIPKAEPLLPAEDTPLATLPAKKPEATPKRSLFATTSHKEDPLPVKAETLIPEKADHEPIATSVHASASDSQRKEMVTSVVETGSSSSVQPPRPSLFASLFQHGAAAPKAKPMPQGQPTIPDHPYVTTGTVIFHDEPASDLSLPSPEGLRQKLLQACGTTVKDVQVKTRSEGGLHVTLTVASETRIEALTHVVLRLPEMQSPQIHLSCAVAP